MTEQELRDIEAALAAVTPGPWEVRSLAMTGGREGWWVRFAGSMYEDSTLMDRKDTAAFIAAAPERIKALLAEVRLLNRLLGDRLALDSPEVRLVAERAVRAERERCALVLEYGGCGHDIEELLTQVGSNRAIAHLIRTGAVPVDPAARQTGGEAVPSAPA